MPFAPAAEALVASGWWVNFPAELELVCAGRNVRLANDSHISGTTQPKGCDCGDWSDQLDNLDAAYKREALAFLSEQFRWDEATPVDELELLNDGEVVEGTLIFMSEWTASCMSDRWVKVLMDEMPTGG